MIAPLEVPGRARLTQYTVKVCIEAAMLRVARISFNFVARFTTRSHSQSHP